jgi:hypothetical protein
MNSKIKFVQENINRLKRMIESANKDKNYNYESLSRLKKELNENTQELSKLMRDQWEETYERLDYGNVER